MKTLLLLAALAAFAAGAAAQTYKWVDKDGKVRYGDTPPGGAKAQRLKPPPGPSAPSPAAAPDGKKPLSPEAAFRKRQQEAQKAAEKAALERQQEETRVANCQRAREALATFESGQRISRTNPQGERYYLDDAARARETEAARKAVQDWCN